jgi:hypothetical protein
MHRHAQTITPARGGATELTPGFRWLSLQLRPDSLIPRLWREPRKRGMFSRAGAFQSAVQALEQWTENLSRN